MNDTGSNTPTVLSTDLLALGIDPRYYPGILGWQRIDTAAGSILRYKVGIETSIIAADGMQISPWFMESGVLTPLGAGFQYRLSGSVMRQHLFFATAPGNATLFVAQRKNGIMMQLPAQ